MFSNEILKLNTMVKNPQALNKLKRGTVEHDLRTKRIVSLYLEHKTYAEICNQLKITAATVKNTINLLLKEWQKNDLKKFQSWRWAELERINKLEAEMWEAWEASKMKPKKMTMNAVSGRIQRDGNGNIISTDVIPTSKRQEVTEEERFSGDLAYWDRIRMCSKDRRELLGLDMPKKIVETGDLEGTKSKLEFTRDEILRKIESFNQQNTLPSKTDYIDAEVDEVPESHRLIEHVEEVNNGS
mgnify:CR=1 FL=1